MPDKLECFDRTIVHGHGHNSAFWRCDISLSKVFEQMKSLDHDREEVTLGSSQRHGLPSNTSEYLPILREMSLPVGMVGILHCVSRDRRAVSEQEGIRISGRTLNHPDPTDAEIGVWDTNEQTSIIGLEVDLKYLLVNAGIPYAYDDPISAICFEFKVRHAGLSYRRCERTVHDAQRLVKRRHEGTKAIPNFTSQFVVSLERRVGLAPIDSGMLWAL